MRRSCANPDPDPDPNPNPNQARLVAPLVRANRGLRHARVTRQAGVLDLRRVQRESDVDLRGRNLSDADALVIVAKLQQRPEEEEEVEP